MITLKVLTHSSGEFTTTVDSFDATDLNKKLNSSEINTVLIGDINISRIDVKLVTPVVTEGGDEV